MVMRHLLAPIFQGMPMAVAYLILLSFDMVFLTYVVMPRYSRLMAFWLRPRADATWRTNVAGLAVIVVILSATLVAFLFIDARA
jgi:antibiotic biosynthesis monooxygenase (ABM) superfamily enzyme